MQFQNPGDVLAFLNANPGVNNLQLYAIDQFRNLGGIKVRAWDFTLDYTLRTDALGRFDFSTLASYLPSYEYQALPSQPYYQFAGAASNSPYAGGTQPHWKVYTTLTWTKGPWVATIGDTYIDGVADEGAGGATFFNSHAIALPVKAYTAVDLRLAYNIPGTWRMKSATVAVGVNNVNGADPPYAPNAFTDNRHDVGTYSPVGRLFYFTLDGRF